MVIWIVKKNILLHLLQWQESMEQVEEKQRSLSLENITEIVETFVTFRALEDDEIKKYIEIFNPLDKAGSYGIQDFLTQELEISPEFKKLMPNCKSFIEKIEGDYFNVMGISLDKLKELLKL